MLDKPRDRQKHWTWIFDAEALGMGVLLLVIALLHDNHHGDQWFAGLVGIWMIFTSLSRIFSTKLEEVGDAKRD